MKKLWLLLLPTLSFLACQPQDTLNLDNCRTIERSNARYENAVSDTFEITNALIQHDCLQLTVRYGGGCGTVDFDLVAIEGEMLSLPPQIPMRLILHDDDNCKALISETLSFDLRPLRLETGAGTHLLPIEGWDEVLEYRY